MVRTDPVIDGVSRPPLLYGTGPGPGKRSRTPAALTELALRQGFAASTTANQRKHYHEGPGRRRAVAASGRRRLVTPRTSCLCRPSHPSAAGRPNGLPYDTPKAPIVPRSKQSFASSLGAPGASGEFDS